MSPISLPHFLVVSAILFAIGCTLVPFTLSLGALKHTSAFSAQLAVSLEPVYAIVLAIVLLGEQHELGAAFYVGVAIILATVLTHALMHRRDASAIPAATAGPSHRSAAHERPP